MNLNVDIIFLQLYQLIILNANIYNYKHTCFHKIHIMDIAVVAIGIVAVLVIMVLFIYIRSRMQTQSSPQAQAQSSPQAQAQPQVQLQPSPPPPTPLPPSPPPIYAPEATVAPPVVIPIALINPCADPNSELCKAQTANTYKEMTVGGVVQPIKTNPDGSFSYIPLPPAEEKVIVPVNPESRVGIWKRLTGYNWIGRNYTSDKLFNYGITADVDSCESKCRRDPECNYYTYNTNNGSNAGIAMKYCYGGNTATSEPLRSPWSGFTSGFLDTA
jgi:hypothetical protein